MNKRKGVIIGIIIFLAVVTFPFVYNRGKAAPAPEVELTETAKAAKQCVRSKDYMQREHMKVLDLWRHVVVRNGERSRDPQLPFVRQSHDAHRC